MPPKIAAVASSSQSNTLAVPVLTIISGATAERLTTQPSTARFPLRTAIPPVAEYGFSIGRMISGFLLTTFSKFSAMVLPVTVISDVSKRFFLVSSFITAGTPPAR